MRIVKIAPSVKDREALESLFKVCFGAECTAMRMLPQAGSDRRYCRMRDDAGHSAIGVISPAVVESKAFIGLSRAFRAGGVSVPEVYCADESFHYYLEEDLGDTALFSMLGTPEGYDIAMRCMTLLPRMQALPGHIWEDAVYEKSFSRRQAMWDLNYFKYEYLKPSGVFVAEDALEDEFELISERLASTPGYMWGFMMRDCQSRNVMVKDGKPFWIDFQGGRKGPAIYDAVSFIWQARAPFSIEERENLFAAYADSFCLIRGLDRKIVYEYLPLFRLFRTLQVLGAYGFRGLVQHRAHFIESIPGALRNLRELIGLGALDDYPELKRVSKCLVNDARFMKLASAGLTVTVTSFSYKKGYPDDFSGNGGGFVFDCRALHNPGRYDRFKAMTGLDRQVADFLEERGEVQPFLQSVWALTDSSVERYIQRGFTSLQISFGCTGGQHRSVYCAETTARHIAEKFSEASVAINHREQNIKESVGPQPEKRI